MDNQNNDNVDNNALSDSLEVPDEPGTVLSAESRPPKPANGRLRRAISHLNVYLLMFIFVVLMAVIGSYIGWQNSQRGVKPSGVTRQLTSEELARLKNNDVRVGDSKQTLSVESNAIFNGKVLLRNDLDVAGGLKLGGGLAVGRLDVAGGSSFEQVNAARLVVGNDAAIQGSLNVSGRLIVSQGGSFGGNVSMPQLTTQNLQLTGDLQLGRHLNSGGPRLSKTDGSALGAGGTASISGNDTAGTLTINTGNGPPAGCFANLSFGERYPSTPRVLITPVGSGASAIPYYVNRSATGFSICTAAPPPGGQNMSFDFFVIN